MVEIISQIVKTDVTCIKCFQNYILAGIGNKLHLFNKQGKLLQIYTAYNGEKIHGIIPNSTNKIAIFGANKIKILEFDFIKSQITKELIQRDSNDWIFALQWIDSDSYITTIFAHNFISLWNSADLTIAKNVACEQKCTLYSANLVNNTWNNLYVLSGTVFGQILIWKPALANINNAYIMYKLEGHDGAIFSIAYSKTLNYIISTSDDRTVRLWETTQNIFSEESDSSNKISLKHTMYGHIARVFRCKVVNNFIVTAGEDSFIHIWDKNGELIRKFETHQGGCIWALDANENEETIVTGGGDSGVSLFPLLLKNNFETLDIVEKETPRVLKMTATGNLIVIMDSGLLKYFNNSAKIWKNIDLIKELKNYAILEMSDNKEILALAGLHGTLHIYKEINNSLILQTFLKNPDNNRIFSLHWLTPSMFITSSVDGVMQCWLINENELEKTDYKFILPVCKERWATCAVLWNKNNLLEDDSKLIVGDRKGNLHLYNFNNEICVQTLRKVHCHLGVTHLKIINYDLYSLGRNGILNKYKMDETKNELIQTTNDKLPFSWLSSMPNSNHSNLIFGFSGSNFIIFNVDQRRIILEINCGGGHRSYDHIITQSNQFYFYFIKEKRINCYSEKWSNIFKNNIVDGYHIKEINCGAIIKLFDVNQYLFISGGEDTTIRLSLIYSNKFKTINTIKSHLSSIRCLTYCALSENEFLILSGGGRAQIILQKLKITPDNTINCQQLHSYYKPLKDNEAETRIMDLITITLNKIILVIAGCSDGNLKCFNIPYDGLNFNYMFDIFYTSRCILRLAFIEINGNYIVLSMGTDGRLVFWNFTEICTNLQNGVTFKGIEMKPFHQLLVHQSGINSFCSYKINDTNFIFASGGDDNTIVLNLINFIINNSTIHIELISELRQNKIHCTQITGLYINKNYIISTAIEQYICVLKYKIENNKIICELSKEYCTSVSDIQGMEFYELNNEIFTCIFGKGIDICCIKNLNDNFENPNVIPKSIFNKK